MNSDKLFGKYHDIILLLIGFLLTTIIGGLVGNFFQQRHWEHQRGADLLQSERVAATRVLENYVILTDKRMYQMQQLRMKIADNSPGEKEEELAKYREVLDEWNMNLNNNRIFIQRYFGKSSSDIFFDRIHDGLKHIGNDLSESYNKEEYHGDWDRAGETAEHLWNLQKDTINPLNLKMIKDIQTGNIGIFNDEVSVGK